LIICKWHLPIARFRIIKLELDNFTKNSNFLPNNSKNLKKSLERKMNYEGVLTKMQTEFGNPIQYYLVFENSFLNLNQILKRHLKLILKAINV
jgi:hypothetical protein